MGTRSWVTKLRIFAACLGVFFGFSAGTIFFFHYGNREAGIWAWLSGILASVALSIAIMLHRQNFSKWYSLKKLKFFKYLGFVVLVVSCAAFVWYIFYAAYYHIPLMPADKSAFLTSVWVFMTAKWGGALMHFSGVAIKQYLVHRRDVNAPLLEES